MSYNKWYCNCGNANGPNDLKCNNCGDRRIGSSGLPFLMNPNTERKESSTTVHHHHYHHHYNSQPCPSYQPQKTTKIYVPLSSFGSVPIRLPPGVSASVTGIKWGPNPYY